VQALGGTGVLVGIDLGTSAVKILACTAGGANVASAGAAYALHTPRPEWVEQDANEVYRTTMKALHGVLADVRLRGDDVLAIGFSVAMHGMLPVDVNGEPLGPLLTWMDRRSASIAERWRADGTAERLYAEDGCTGPSDAAVVQAALVCRRTCRSSRRGLRNSCRSRSCSFSAGPASG
jgi:gluconokinase